MPRPRPRRRSHDLISVPSILQTILITAHAINGVVGLAGLSGRSTLATAALILALGQTILLIAAIHAARQHA